MSGIAVKNEPFARLCRSLLSEGHSVRFAAKGASMFPFICDGDVLTVESVGADALRVGDVVLHERPDGRLVAHSLVRKETLNGKTLQTTRADGLPDPEVVFDSRLVLGRVVSVRMGRRTVSLDWPVWRALSLILLGPERLSRGPGPAVRGLVRFLEIIPWLLRRSIRGGPAKIPAS